MSQNVEKPLQHDAGIAQKFISILVDPPGSEIGHLSSSRSLARNKDDASRFLTMYVILSQHSTSIRNTYQCSRHYSDVAVFVYVDWYNHSRNTKCIIVLIITLSDITVFQGISLSCLIFVLNHSVRCYQ